MTEFNNLSIEPYAHFIDCGSIAGILKILNWIGSCIHGSYNRFIWTYGSVPKTKHIPAKSMEDSIQVDVRNCGVTSDDCNFGLTGYNMGQISVNP